MLGAGNNERVINLSKNAKINLSKEAKLHKVMVGLGWIADDMDLDASVFMLDGRGKSKADDFIFYGNLSHYTGCVQHQGDDRVGGSGDDDEQIFIDLDNVPNNIQKIMVVITIADDGKNFGMVHSGFCRLFDVDGKAKEVRIDLAEDFSVETGVIMCEIYRQGDDWKLSNLNQGFSGGLLALCNRYGIPAEYR